MSMKKNVYLRELLLLDLQIESKEDWLLSAQEQELINDSDLINGLCIIVDLAKQKCYQDTIKLALLVLLYLTNEIAEVRGLLKSVGANENPLDLDTNIALLLPGEKFAGRDICWPNSTLGAARRDIAYSSAIQLVSSLLDKHSLTLMDPHQKNLSWRLKFLSSVYEAVLSLTLSIEVKD
jgi:hypothetical protein